MAFQHRISRAGATFISLSVGWHHFRLFLWPFKDPLDMFFLSRMYIAIAPLSRCELLLSGLRSNDNTAALHRISAIKFRAFKHQLRCRLTPQSEAINNCGKYSNIPTSYVYARQRSASRRNTKLILLKYSIYVFPRGF